MENDKPKEGEKEQQSQPSAEKVELSADQYEALLDRLQELETLAQKPAKQQEGPIDIETLAAQAKEPSMPKEDEDIDIDELPPKQLLKLIEQQITNTITPLMEEVQTLKVLREIDKCEAKYPDFWDYEEDLRQIAMSNPMLTIEQAYQLAKAGKGEKGEDKEKETSTKTRTEKLLRLPPRPRATAAEKPGVATSSTEKKDEIKTIKSAAERAWEEVIGSKEG